MVIFLDTDQVQCCLEPVFQCDTTIIHTEEGIKLKSDDGKWLEKDYITYRIILTTLFLVCLPPCYFYLLLI